MVSQSMCLNDQGSFMKRTMKPIAVLLAFAITIPFYGIRSNILFAENTVFESSTTVDNSISLTANNRLTLDLKGVELDAVLRLFSLKTGKTIVASKNVTGRVTLFLNDVSFEDAFDVLLITQGLATEQHGDILMVFSKDEYRQRHGKDFGELRKVRRYKLDYASPSSVFGVLSEIKSEIGRIVVDESTGMIVLLDIEDKLNLMEAIITDLDTPLATEVYDLEYTESDNVLDQLSSIVTKGTGKVVIDDQTNTVMISDLPQRMELISKVMDRLDREPPQVYIEAEIWQISLRDEYQKGINWEKFFDSLHIIPDSPDATVTGAFPVSPSFQGSPALGDSNQFKLEIGSITDNHYTLTLKMLEAYGEVKIISRPNISVLNGEEAKIMVGERRAYVTQTLSQGESSTVTSEDVEFIDVGIKLNVVPRIAEDGMISMSIRPEISSVLETLTTSLGSEIPIVETSEAETRVKVQDGRMIVIGGLMKEESRDDNSRFPGISHIPLLGKLFTSKAQMTKTTELVLLIKPKIITGKQTPDLQERVLGRSEFEKADISLDEIRAGEYYQTNAVTPETEALDEIKPSDTLKKKLKGFKGI